LQLEIYLDSYMLIFNPYNFFQMLKRILKNMFCFSSLTRYKFEELMFSYHITNSSTFFVLHINLDISLKFSVIAHFRFPSIPTPKLEVNYIKYILQRMAFSK